MAIETFPVRSRPFERGKRALTAQHIFAAIMLVMAAVGHLTDEESHHVVLPVLELLTGVILIGAVVRDKLRKTHSPVGWIELAGAAMTFVEAIAKLQDRHHPLYHVLTFIPPVILLLFGLFDERLRNRPYLGVDDEAFEVRLRPLWPLRRVRFEDLERYRITSDSIDLVRRDGKVISLKRKDIENDEEAVAWLGEQFERRGLSQ